MTGALDIGGTKIAAAVVTAEGRILARAECPTAPERGFDDAFGRMRRMLGEAVRGAAAAIDGIGIGCTGPVDPIAGVIGDVEFLPGWKGAPIVERLAAEFGIPAAMENDADAAALAEARWGAGAGVARFIYVTISTGIGGGMVFDGKLYRGAGGAHPEVGHHVHRPLWTAVLLRRTRLLGSARERPRHGGVDDCQRFVRARPQRTTRLRAC